MLLEALNRPTIDASDLTSFSQHPASSFLESADFNNDLVASLVTTIENGDEAIAQLEEQFHNSKVPLPLAPSQIV